ncbi:WGR domain-containing protein [Agrobacterium fabrum]|uniref:WGR domain-containing protein n=1 Tax=Agrobacterium fabrum TaxID=1176649 RepID=UPI003B9DE71B
MNRSWLTDSKLSLDADSETDDSAVMIAQPYHLYVERIDAAKNMARFYSLSIQPTLFGEASLLRCWGRIGSRGKQMIHMFAAEEHAVELFLDLLSEKRKKGYRPRTSCGNPG